ncbi:unnamed protein product [Caenorhabditis nigoni]
MLTDAGIPVIETEKLQIMLFLTAVVCPIVYIMINRKFPNWIASRRKLIIWCTTIIIISIQLMLGAVILNKSVKGFEVNLRLSISLKSMCFVIVSAFSISPVMIHEIYSDAISPHCTERVNPYAVSNMGCSLIRFFTLLPMVIICALFHKPEDYVPCFTALLPLLSVNVMAYALEQPPKIHLVSGNDRTDEIESQF